MYAYLEIFKNLNWFFKISMKISRIEVPCNKSVRSKQIESRSFSWHKKAFAIKRNFSMTVDGSPGRSSDSLERAPWIKGIIYFFISKLNCPEAVIGALSVNDTTCVTIVRLGERIGPGFRANPPKLTVQSVPLSIFAAAPTVEFLYPACHVGLFISV